MNKMRIAVLGAGGLGKAAAQIISVKEEMSLAAICDSRGFAYCPDGLVVESIVKLDPKETVGGIVDGKKTNDGIGEVIALGNKIDGVFVALPNLPNEFIPGVAKRFLKSNFSGVFSDALKRTRAVELMFELDEEFKKNQSVYLVGCGATPGLLTAAAVIAAQSFVKVESVDIWWGVGIANWDAYKATIREDIGYLPGFSVEKAKTMTDVEVEELLDQTEGKLVLHEMEHADDILLQRVGVVESREQVKVGGVMDTRHAKKPVTTTMTLTGITYEGKRSQHKFMLGDETTMAANVIGPALGYLKRAQWLKAHGLYGMFGSTEFMPMVVQ